MWGTKSASYNLCVFDLGEQIVNSNECCDEVVKIKTRSEGGDGGKISCVANHGGKNCSNAFGINNGRCTFNPNVCMDYNGWYDRRSIEFFTRYVDVITKRYKDKVSGPLLDRIDIHVEVSPVEYDELSNNSEGEKSRDIKKRVDKAREIQRKRFEGTDITCNAKMTPKITKECCVLSEEADNLLHESFDSFAMSARAYDKVLRLARTIADLAESKEIKLEHIAEALQFRTLDRKYWDE